MTDAEALFPAEWHGPLDLASTYEVGEILRVSRQRVGQLTAKPNFPTPVAELATGRIWWAQDIRDYGAVRPSRRGRPREPTAPEPEA